MAPKAHPLPVVIPHDRITGTHGEIIGNDAVLYCTRDLKTCIPTGFRDAVHAWTPTCDAQGSCRASVEFASSHSKMELFVVCIIAFESWIFVMILSYKDGIHTFFADRIETNFNRKLRRFVLLSATGHNETPRLPDAARNKETLMTYFPKKGSACISCGRTRRSSPHGRSRRSRRRRARPTAWPRSGRTWRVCITSSARALTLGSASASSGAPTAACACGTATRRTTRSPPCRTRDVPHCCNSARKINFYRPMQLNDQVCPRALLCLALVAPAAVPWAYPPAGWSALRSCGRPATHVFTCYGENRTRCLDSGPYSCTTAMCHLRPSPWHYVDYTEA